VALYRRAAALPCVEPVGLAVHIGSQIVSMAPYRRAFERVAELVQALRGEGLGVGSLDCGGGLGISYRDEIEASPEAFAGVLRTTLGELGLRLSVEPGRWLAGPAGVLLSSVVQEKQAGTDRRFVVLDAAMNDLVRPAMYEAWHGVVPVSAADAVAPCSPADVVGPVCESADLLARDRDLPTLRADARVAILDTGAYGAVMSSTYNARPLAAQVMVDGARWSVIRPRQAIAAMWSEEQVPGWL
jgi:diaminopimelate decarboxylase